MSIWQKFGDIYGQLTKLANPRTTGPNLPATAKDLGQIDLSFAAAVVALAAKMAKADGITTQAETDAFIRAFPMRPEDKRPMMQLFSLAQQTVHGFESYAKKLARRFANAPALLDDVLDILYIIATADGLITHEEDAFLARVADLFGIDSNQRAYLAHRHLPHLPQDPYTILGVGPRASAAEVRQAWLNGVANAHPDRFMGRGGPQDFVKSANDRTARLNDAYAAIRKMRMG